METEVRVQESAYHGMGWNTSGYSGDVNLTFVPFDGVPPLNPDFTRSIPYPGHIKKRPLWEAYVKVTFYAAVMAVALIGNCLVISIVVRNKRMWTTTNYYLVNLAVSDLMVTCSCSWVHLVDDLTEGWILGAFFCKANSFLQLLSLICSIMTLTLISCDRFFGIVFAMKAHLTRRRARTLIVAVWVFSIGVSAPVLVFREQFSRQWADHLEIWCDDTWPPVMKPLPGTNLTTITYPSRTFYYTFVSLVLYFLPITVMGFAYGCIAFKLRTAAMPGEHVHSEVSIRDRNRKKIIGMLAAIVFIFALCWLPFQVKLLYAEYRPFMEPLPHWFPGFEYFSIYAANANSAFNPIIYSCFNENFRRGFRQVACCYGQHRRRLIGSPVIARDASYRSTSRSTRVVLLHMGSYERSSQI